MLTINGQRPLLLSSGQVEYFSAAFYLRNPLAELPQDALSIARSRFVGDSLQERIVIRNESMEPLRFEVGLELGCDFADIFTVKEHDFTLGDPENAKPLPPPAAADWDDDGSLAFADGGDSHAGAVLATRAARTARAPSWEVELAQPRAVGARRRGAPRRGRRQRRDRPARRSARSWRTSATRSPPGTSTCRR